jgi:proton-dependent oligopeptide transporter, POT family
MTDTATAPLPEAVPAEAREDKMPSGIPFIVSNEFAERFCYYGISAILTLHLVQNLGFGEAKANVYSALFQGGAYFFPFLGAIISDVFWGKFRTIMVFSTAYAMGCATVALMPGSNGLVAGLFLVAVGTGGIKPCVSTNVGDQFTSKNKHLIDRAFSFFYFAINAGSSISIWFCPVLLDKYGPRAAFGMPAVMMFMAVIVFWLGRKKYAVVPPAGKAWLRDVFSKDGLKTILSLGIIYVFLGPYWSLWNQSSGQTWTLQARSSLMDKNVGFGFTLLPAQIQVVNGFFILGLIPIFTFIIYPLWGKVTQVTPLRKMAVGMFVIASSYLILARIEGHIQVGETVSVWWQILAYFVLTISEILVSITALEFSYKQAPLRMKSFIMAMFLASSSLGNVITAGINYGMTQPLHAQSAEVGAATWVTLDDTSAFATGQKIDFSGELGVQVVKADGKTEPLAGTYLVSENDKAGHRLKLMDVVDRKDVPTQGAFDVTKATVSTYRLVGPEYFSFFAAAMAVFGLLFIVVAYFYKEKTHVRDEEAAASA